MPLVWANSAVQDESMANVDERSMDKQNRNIPKLVHWNVNYDELKTSEYSIIGADQIHVENPPTHFFLNGLACRTRERLLCNAFLFKRSNNDFREIICKERIFYYREVCNKFALFEKKTTRERERERSKKENLISVHKGKPKEKNNHTHTV